MHILTKENAPLDKADMLYNLGMFSVDMLYNLGIFSDATMVSSEIVGDMMLSLLPKPPSKAKTGAKWLSSAASTDKNEVRLQLKVLWAIDGMLYASDGHRMHRMATDLPNGCYDPKTLELVASDDLKPYRFNEIFNSFNHGDAKLFLPSELTRVINKNCNEPMGKSISLVHPNIGFLCLERYFLQATNGEQGATISASKDGKQLYGQSDFGDYIVMLTRFDINEFKNALETQK